MRIRRIKSLKLISHAIPFFIVTCIFINCDRYQSHNNNVVIYSSNGNVMNDIINDLQLNEAELLNAPVGPGWSKGAIIGMGNKASGDATPYWWTPDNLLFKSSKTWNAITPWFVLYPGVNHTALNVRVKIYDIAIFILEKSTNSWKKINANISNPTWAETMAFKLDITGHAGPSTPRVEPDGNLSYKLNDQFYPIHGGISKFEINGDDVVAVFTQLTTQLILDDPMGTDDRSQAQLLMSVGADYYYDIIVKIADYTPMTYNPGIGASRFGMVREKPRIHYFSTIDAIGFKNKYSDYLKTGESVTIPTSQFEANPPPHLHLSPL